MRHRSVCRGRTTSPCCNCNCVDRRFSEMLTAERSAAQCFVGCDIVSAADCSAVGHPEFDVDDSDRSSVYSTPSPQTRQFQTLAPSSVAMATAAAGPGGVGGSCYMYRQSLGVTSGAYHPSLRKKKWFDRQSSVSAMMTGRQSTLEKSWSLQPDRPVSLLAPYSSVQSSIIANKVADTLLQQVRSVLSLYSLSS